VIVAAARRVTSGDLGRGVFPAAFRSKVAKYCDGGFIADFWKNSRRLGGSGLLCAENNSN
jgi:hypothetical protein